jgi:hypothetical protein
MRSAAPFTSTPIRLEGKRGVGIIYIEKAERGEGNWGG